MELLPEIPDFDVLSCLGYGARSTIYAVSEQRTNQVYALKRVVRHSSDDDRFLEQAEQEFAISSQFGHPVLRKSHRLIRRRKLLKVSELYLLMDLFDGTSLDVDRPSSLQTLVRTFGQVAQGLAAMHRLGFVHADIKPNNILINDRREAKVIDFGQSCAIGTVKSRIQGTPDYIAPEQVGRGPLTPLTDVFNLGATMYWCLTDRHVPTLIPKKKYAVASIDSTELKPPHELNPRVPLTLSKLVMECVRNQPSQRPRDMASVFARLELAVSATTAVVLESKRERSGRGGFVPLMPDSKDSKS